MEVEIADRLTKELIMKIDTLKKLEAIIRISKRKITLGEKYKFEINFMVSEHEVAKYTL
jgi:hypothetical protein